MLRQQAHQWSLHVGFVQFHVQGLPVLWAYGRLHTRCSVGPRGLAWHQRTRRHPRAEKGKAARGSQASAALDGDRKLIAEERLAEALAPYNCRLGFLDFETIQRAVPAWPGMARGTRSPRSSATTSSTILGACSPPPTGPGTRRVPGGRSLRLPAAPGGAHGRGDARRGARRGVQRVREDANPRITAYSSGPPQHVGNGETAERRRGLARG